MIEVKYPEPGFSYRFGGEGPITNNDVKVEQDTIWHQIEPTLPAVFEFSYKWPDPLLTFIW